MKAIEKLTSRTINLICGWCHNHFDTIITRDKKDDARSILICPHCARTLPSSKKESTGKVVGRQHIHTEWKNGDIV